MGKIAKPLLPDEMPGGLRPHLIFDKQEVTKKKSSIWAMCWKCGYERWVPVGRIRFLLKEGTYTGLCPSCCSRRNGPDNPNWKGGTWVHKGYIAKSHSLFLAEEQVLLGDMFTLGGGRYVYEHRAAMALHLGRPLKSGEAVRHLNGDKTDNRIGNLALGTSAENNMDHITLRYEIKRLRRLNNILISLLLADNSNRG